MMTQKWLILTCLIVLTISLLLMINTATLQGKIERSQCEDNPSVTHISLPNANRYLKTDLAALKEFGNLNAKLGDEDKVLLTTYQGKGASGMLLTLYLLRLKEKTVTKLYEATEYFRCFYQPDGGIVLAMNDRCLLLDETGKVLQQTVMGDEKDAWADSPHAYHSHGQFRYAGIAAAGDGYSIDYYSGGAKTELSKDVVNFEGLYATSDGRYLMFREAQGNKLKLLDMKTGQLVSSYENAVKWGIGEGVYWACKASEESHYQYFYFDPNNAKVLDITQAMAALQQELNAGAIPSNDPSYSWVQVPVTFASSNYFLLANSLYRFKDYQQFEYIMELPAQVYSLYAGNELTVLTDVECTCPKKQGHLFDLMRVE